MGAAFMLATIGCGRSGISGTGNGLDGSVNSSGGGQGGSSATEETGGQGGTTDTAVSSSGGSRNPGGSKAIGGSWGGQSGSVVSPREPKMHRPQATSCAGVFAPPEPVNPQNGNCKKHADCTGGTNGRCITSNIGSGSGWLYYCTFDKCATDADCDPGKVCFCGAGNAPTCFSLGNCRTDADCGGGANSFCSPAYGSDCGGYHWYSGYYCHTPKDTCIDDGDCTGKDYCDYDVIDGRWECKSPNMMCAIG